MGKVCDLRPFKLELVVESIGTDSPRANNGDADYRLSREQLSSTECKMSQASNPVIVKPSSSQAAPGANATISRETLLNYLVQASKTMRRVELGVGIAGWLCVMVVVLLLAILIDHWLWPLNMFARFAVFGSLVAWTLWWGPSRILPLVFRPIHPEHAARKIESQYPEIKESLISWLQLSTNSENAAPKGVLAVIGRFAVRNLGGHDSSNIIDSANLIRLAALLFGFLLTGSVYLFVAPKSGVTSLTRMLMPWANISPAARVRIVSVTPGNATITQGTNLPLAVTLRGMHKGDSVFVRYDLSDGQRVGQRLKLNEELEGINYKLDFGKSFGGIHQPLQYWIEAGDATEGPFDLRVQVVPIVAIDRLDFEFPAYTKLKPKSIQKDGLIEAPEGTRVSLHAHANQPMAKSRLEFNPVINNGVFHSASGILDLQTSETQLTGKWLLKLDKKKSNPTIETYRIKATNSLGESNGDPVIYKMKVIGDLPPKVSLQSDLPSIIELSVHDSLEIEMRANDPDYGLVSLAATAKLDSDNTIKEKKTVFESNVFESTNGATGQIDRVFTFSPKEHNLQVGDRIEFRAIGSDNRCQPGTDVPEPNQSSSTPILIRIVNGPKNTKNSQEDKEQQKPDSSDDKKQRDNSKSKTDDKKGKNQNNSKSSTSDNKPQDQKTKEGTSNQESNDKPGEPENQDLDPQETNSQEQEKNQDKNSQSKKDGQSSSGKSDKQDKSKDKKKSSKDKEGGSGGESSDEGEGESQGSGSQSNNGNSKKTSKSSSSKGNQSTNDASNGEGADSEPGESEDSNPAGQTSRTQSRLKNSSKQNANNAEPSTENGESSNPDKDLETPKHDGEAFERLLDEMQRNKGNDKDQQDPQDDKQSDDKQSDDKQSDGKQSDGKQSDGKQSDGKQSDGKHSDGKQSDGKQSDGKQSDGKQSDGKQADGKKSDGKQSEQQKPGEGSGESEGEGGKSGSKSSKPSSNSSGGDASGSKETENVGAGGSNKRTSDSPDGQAEDAKQNYADKTTDLALDYLRKQKDQPDPELLKRMNWTKEDMQKFLQRWTEAKEQAKSDPNKKRELDATLRSLGLRPSKSRERKIEDQDDDLKGLLEEGNRVRPPETLREKWEQYRKANGNL